MTLAPFVTPVLSLPELVPPPPLSSLPQAATRTPLAKAVANINPRRLDTSSPSVPPVMGAPSGGPPSVAARHGVAALLNVPGVRGGRLFGRNATAPRHGANGS